MISTAGSCACLSLTLAPSNFIWLAPLLHHLELVQGARPRAGCFLRRGILGRLPDWLTQKCFPSRGSNSLPWEGVSSLPCLLFVPPDLLAPSPQAAPLTLTACPAPVGWGLVSERAASQQVKEEEMVAFAGLLPCWVGRTAPLCRGYSSWPVDFSILLFARVQVPFPHLDPSSRDCTIPVPPLYKWPFHQIPSVTPV